MLVIVGAGKLVIPGYLSPLVLFHGCVECNAVAIGQAEILIGLLCFWFRARIRTVVLLMPVFVTFLYFARNSRIAGTSCRCLAWMETSGRTMETFDAAVLGLLTSIAVVESWQFFKRQGREPA
jgi:hypothetical protein